jgi:hypothetical protein
MSMLILFLAFCVASAIGVPIYIGLGASSVVYLLFTNPSFLAMVPQRIFAGTDSFMMIALPLFILAGDLMNRGGITKRIIDFSLHVVRPIKGGLAEVNVVASMIFGGISGSSVADTSALGSILIPSMEKKGLFQGLRHRHNGRFLDHGHDHTSQRAHGHLRHGIRRVHRQALPCRPHTGHDDRRLSADSRTDLQAHQATCSGWIYRTSPCGAF